MELGRDKTGRAKIAAPYMLHVSESKRHPCGATADEVSLSGGRRLRRKGVNTERGERQNQKFFMYKMHSKEGTRFGRANFLFDEKQEKRKGWLRTELHVCE